MIFLKGDSILRRKPLHIRSTLPRRLATILVILGMMNIVSLAERLSSDNLSNHFVSTMKYENYENRSTQAVSRFASLNVGDYYADLSDYKDNLFSGINKTFRYGVDEQSIPFALRPGGVTGRFLDVSPNRFKLQIETQRILGNIEFNRISTLETLTRFEVTRGDKLLVRTRKVRNQGGAYTISISFQYRNDQVSVKIDEGTSRNGFTAKSENEVRDFFSKIRKNPRLATLIEHSRTLTENSVVSGVMHATMYNAPVDSLACVIAAGECILTIAAYVGSISGLMALCPETIGASCLAALLLHPVISVLVAAKCADALIKCNVTPPPTPTKAQYQQACLDFGGFWDSSGEECIPLNVVFPSPGTCGGLATWNSASGCLPGFVRQDNICTRSFAFQQTCDPAVDPYDESQCECVPLNQSPIIIDVLGDGFALTNPANGVDFNFSGQRSQRTSWTRATSDDAFLTLDRNGNGTVDYGGELFGNYTPQSLAGPGIIKNGFNALQTYDKEPNGGNNDGLLDSNDSVFSSLRLWQDTNHNGSSEPSELHTLTDLGLTSLDLKYKESKHTDQYGNQFRYRAKVTDIHGGHAGRWAWDVFLKVE
jgi:hypothetical protein